VDSAKTDEESAHATAILRQAEEHWRNGDPPVYNEVSVAPSRGLNIQVGTSVGGQTTALKSCLKLSSQQNSTRSGQ
jgi:hypothetical protein